eukprot:4556239-Prymnesium_polylepis.1
MARSTAAAVDGDGSIGVHPCAAFGGWGGACKGGHSGAQQSYRCCSDGGGSEGGGGEGGGGE